MKAKVVIIFLIFLKIVYVIESKNDEKTTKSYDDSYKVPTKRPPANRTTATVSVETVTVISNSTAKTTKAPKKEKNATTLATTKTTKATTPKPPKILGVCSKGFTNATVNNTNITCIKDSLGKKRPVDEIDCIFPFQYKGVWRDKCIKADAKHYWCSLDRIYENRSAICEQECPYLARELVKNEPNQPKHTTCVNSKPGVKGHFPNAKEIKTIIEWHNKIRSEVNVSAENMKAVSWDFGLARLAQRWAENADLIHDCRGCRKLLNNRTVPVGQNGFQSFGIKYNPTTFWSIVMQAWDGEKEHFKYGQQMILTDVGHYTQIIFADAIRVGCGAASIGNEIYAYCNYAMAQMNFRIPYKNGTTCSSCSKSNCKNKLCTCNKLCQNYGVLDPVSCKCNCLAYTSGPECENINCSKSDFEYGCFRPNDPRLCSFVNTVLNCPHLCGICSLKKS